MFRNSTEIAESSLRNIRKFVEKYQRVRWEIVPPNEKFHQKFHQRRNVHQMSGNPPPKVNNSPASTTMLHHSLVKNWYTNLYSLNNVDGWVYGMWGIWRRLLLRVIRVNCVELSCIVYRVRWNLWIEKVDNVTLPHRWETNSNVKIPCRTLRRTPIVDPSRKDLAWCWSRPLCV